MRNSAAARAPPADWYPGYSVIGGNRCMKKQDVLDLIKELPDEFDADDLMYRLYVLAKIDKSEASIAEHGLISDEDIEREIAE
jgi:hypothetical protein